MIFKVAERHTTKKGPGRKHAEPSLRNARADKVVFTEGEVMTRIRRMSKLERGAQHKTLTLRSH